MKALLICCLVATGAHIQAQPKKERNTLVKEYEVKNVKSVMVDNDQAAITIKVWDKSTVQVSATLRSNGHEGDTDNLDFDVRERVGTLRIKPLLKKGGSPGRGPADAAEAEDAARKARQAAADAAEAEAAARKAGRKAASVSSAAGNKAAGVQYYNGSGTTVYSSSGNCGCGDFEENSLVITLPRSMALELKNKTGSILVEDDLDVLKLTMGAGNFEGRNVKNLTLGVMSGTASFEVVETADMELHDAGFSAERIGKWTLDTRFSRINVEKVGDLTLDDSESDNIDFEQLGSVKGQFLFTNLKVYKLLSTAELITNSGSVKIRSFGADAGLVKLEGKFTDIDINLRSLPGYDIAAKTVFTSLRLPGRFVESSNTPETYTESKGAGQKAKIDIDCNSCNVTLK